MIKEMNHITESIGPFIRGVKWDDDVAYCNWLSQAHCLVLRSVPYLGLALFHSAQYPDFQKRCTAHIAEETGHEKLIENDVKKLGLKLMPELPSTSAIYQTQYYRIVNENPLSFLGYIFLLEFLAPAYGPYIMERVKNKSALSFLKVHTAADEDHIEKAMKIFESLPADLKSKVMSNFRMSSESYKLMLSQIAINSESTLAAA